MAAEKTYSAHQINQLGSTIKQAAGLLRELATRMRKHRDPELNVLASRCHVQAGGLIQEFQDFSGAGAKGIGELEEIYYCHENSCWRPSPSGQDDLLPAACEDCRDYRGLFT